MRITFTARHGKASEELKKYAENEVRRLKKYYRKMKQSQQLMYQSTEQIAIHFPRFIGNVR